jgi:hypothetical protein
VNKLLRPFFIISKILSRFKLSDPYFTATYTPTNTKLLSLLSAMLDHFFNTFYDEEVITEEAFMTWKRDKDPSRQEGKGPALQATASFFEWVQSAAVEGSEN